VLAITYAIRNLRRAPVYALSAIVVLALGAGANIGAFSAVRDLVWRPLPYPSPERLVSLFETASDGSPRAVAEANLLDWAAQAHTFDSMAAYRPRSFGLTFGDTGAPTVIQTGQTMATFFQVAAIRPALGRSFSSEEETAEAHVIVLTDRLWRGIFAADPQAPGRVVELNEEPYTIVGVMPAGFEFPIGDVQPDAFIPLSRRDYCCGRTGSLSAAGRVKPGFSLDAARAELAAVASNGAAIHPAANRGGSAGMLPLSEAFTASRRESLLLLYAASSLLFLIACANVSGLMLARWMSRQRELAIRVSLGARGRQLAAPFFAEAAILAFVAAALGLFAAEGIERAIPRFLTGVPVPPDLDGYSFAFAAVLACVTTIVTASAPLLITRRASLNSTLKGGATRLRGAFAIAQIALSVALLLSAGLLLHSFLNLVNADPGFTTARAWRFGIGIPERRYNTEAKEIQFHQRLLGRLAALPDVSSAGATGRLPLGGSPGSGGAFQIAGAGIPPVERPRARTNVASPAYFASMGIPLLRGRDFSWTEDRPGGRRVVIVNQAFASGFLRDRDPIGASLELGWTSELNPRNSLWEVVGVAGNTRQNSMDRNPAPEIFLSMTQTGADGAGYVIRARDGRGDIARVIAETVVQFDPRVQRVHPTPLVTLIERNLDSRATAIKLIGGFGAVALLLTAAGIFGIVAFHAQERSREMAIRMALGSPTADVQRLIILQALRLAGVGSSIGVFGFWWGSPWLRNQLYGVGRADAATFAGVLALVAAVAVAASLAPSRRASRTDPARLLRES
jgi:predicted permease